VHCCNRSRYSPNHSAAADRYFIVTRGLDMNASTPGHAPDSQTAANALSAKDPVTNGKTWRYGIYAIIGAIGCPPMGIVFAISCLREPKKSKRWSIFARVVSGFVGLSVIAYSLLFAGGRLPLTGWVIPDQPQ
jgi:hypothetical protein